jgi:phosphoserine phosphatase
MRSNTKFYIVRHGQSHGNVAQQNEEYADYTSTDSGTPLTDKGQNQAQQLAKQLQHVQFDKVFSSDLLRAKQTAEIIAEEKKLEISVTKAIRERDNGSFGENITKKAKQDMENLIHALETEQEKMNFRMVPDMESMEEAAKRLITFLREAGVVYAGENLLIVCHGGLMRYFLLKLGYASYAELPAGSIDNTGYLVVESDGIDFMIKETHGVNKKVER